MSAGTVAFRDCRYKVSDLQAAKEFYSRSFGLKPYFDEPTWVIFQIHDYKLWLEPDNLTEESVYESVNPGYVPSRHILTYWIVQDVHEIAIRFRNFGGIIFKAPKKDGPFTVAIVKDPWGNKLGLHSKIL